MPASESLIPRPTGSGRTTARAAKRDYPGLLLYFCKRLAVAREGRGQGTFGTPRTRPPACIPYCGAGQRATVPASKAQRNPEPRGTPCRIRKRPSLSPKPVPKLPLRGLRGRRARAGTSRDRRSLHHGSSRGRGKFDRTGYQIRRLRPTSPIYSFVRSRFRTSLGFCCPPIQLPIYESLPRSSSVRLCQRRDYGSAPNHCCEAGAAFPPLREKRPLVSLSDECTPTDESLSWRR